MAMATKLQNFIIRPGSVEQLADDHEETSASWVYDEPMLYDELVLAGYPLTNDESLGAYFIDLAVDPERLDDVIVFTSNPAGEYHMGPASGLFGAWHVLNVLHEA